MHVVEAAMAAMSSSKPCYSTALCCNNERRAVAEEGVGSLYCDAIRSLFFVVVKAKGPMLRNEQMAMA